MTDEQIRDMRSKAVRASADLFFSEQGTVQQLLVRVAAAAYAQGFEDRRQVGDTAQPEGWRSMDSAPKGKRILLFFPPFGAWIATSWHGSWSYEREQWVIHTPFLGASNKSLFGVDAPQPIGWQPPPPPPSTPPKDA